MADILPYSQTNRPLAVTNPLLGPDDLLLEKFSGSEGMSSLFHFTLDLLAERGKEIPFEKMLGKLLSVRVTDGSGQPRRFHGICSRFRQGVPVSGPKGPATFVRYHAEMVPEFWLWTRNVQSRIFQHKTVVEILKVVLDGLNFSLNGLQGDFPTRTYCAQYRESDFAFASRLMEEEGLAYHFVHDEKSHQLVITNDNSAFSYMPEPSKTLEWCSEGVVSKTGTFIHAWEKGQEVCAQKFTLRDHSFELPHSDLEECLPLLDSVEVGPVKHALKLAAKSNLEVYDFPAGYGSTFDEVDRNGAANPKEMEKVRPDAARRAKLRMEQEASQSLRIEAGSNCAHCQPGFKVAVTQLGLSCGSYLLTRVTHQADLRGTYRTGGEAEFVYTNQFHAVPESLRYRPASVTPRPRILGTQTAIVVGTEEGGIHTDKYGRVKVQFHWDREGKKDIDSSCWIRVLQSWAGQGWGSLQLPRAGQEVVVDFLEGNPDRPIILGSVYNAAQGTPYTLPDHASVSGIKSRSLTSKNGEHFNEIRLDDKLGSELFVLQAQKDLNTVVEHDDTLTVGHDSTITVGGTQKATIGDLPATMNYILTWNSVEINKLTKSVVTGVGSSRVTGGLDSHITIGGAVHVISPIWTHTVLGVSVDTVLGKRSEITVGSSTESISGDHRERTDGNHDETIGGKQKVTVGRDQEVTVSHNVSVTALGLKDDRRGNITLSANREMKIEGGAQKGEHGYLKISPASARKKLGEIEAKGYNVRLMSSDGGDLVYLALKMGSILTIQAGDDPNSNKIELTDGQIDLVCDMSNYIRISPQGIEIKALSYDLDVDTLIKHRGTQEQVV